MTDRPIFLFSQGGAQRLAGQLIASRSPFVFMRALLILSLLGNVILAAFVFSKEGTPLYAALHPQKAIPPDVLEARKEAWAASAFVKAMKSEDLVAVRDRLRDLGFSEDVVRGVIESLVNRPVAALEAQIRKTQDKHRDVFWKEPLYPFSTQQTTAEQMNALREARHFAAKQMDDLLGIDPNDGAAFRTDFLAPEKALKVRTIERDYNDLRNRVLVDAHGLRLPADDEKIAYLEEEKRNDLAAVLTPEELGDYDLRTSSTAIRLRTELQGFDATTAEYKAIFASQKKIDDEFGSAAPVSGLAVLAYKQAQAEEEAEIHSALGDARYKAYQQSQDPDYRALQWAAARYDLPATAVEQTYLARDQAIATAQIIQNNLNLTDDQRRQQLAQLADHTRIQIQTTLGAEASVAYLETHMNWLQVLQAGTPIAADSQGMIHAANNPRR